jgi:large subunit ribosomal protein L6
MKEKINEEIELTGGVQASLEKNLLVLKGQKGENQKDFNNPLIQIKVDGNKIKLSSKRLTKREKTLAGTFKAHIKNMIKGATEGYIYKLKICSSHFPMNVSINNDELIVKNFFGEKSPRTLKMKPGVTTKIDGSEIIIESTNKELAGQAAADIEQLTRITNKDRRIFQDGIYIIEKDGKKI